MYDEFMIVQGRLHSERIVCEKELRHSCNKYFRHIGNGHRYMRLFGEVSDRDNKICQEAGAL